ncbi:MAG: tautomerase family protein [Chloroflexi bacterium]|nr:tautomerase family protein [Chloroflexota bacterium]
MPVITINQFEGRTIEQKRKLAKEITDSIVKIYEVGADSVSITYFDIPKHNAAKGGKLFID